METKGGLIWAWIFEGTKNTKQRKILLEYERILNIETCRAKLLDYYSHVSSQFMHSRIRKLEKIVDLEILNPRSPIIIPMNWNFFPIPIFSNSRISPFATGPISPPRQKCIRERSLATAFTPHYKPECFDYVYWKKNSPRNGVFITCKHAHISLHFRIE